MDDSNTPAAARFGRHRGQRCWFLTLRNDVERKLDVDVRV
jgi:hypothetical protein